ncbi:hypothetical protein OHC33_004228 [Knufia fluminis]|uniref:Uncharacterized protein n=2 Tax=Knufia TaxID=430999 RepID=A0AAN8FAD7_9EURO|nr:hypothetical protein OHC33_004228 [Knufia fluminis]
MLEGRPTKRLRPSSKSQASNTRSAPNSSASLLSLNEKLLTNVLSHLTVNVCYNDHFFRQPLLSTLLNVACTCRHLKSVALRCMFREIAFVQETKNHFHGAGSTRVKHRRRLKLFTELCSKAPNFLEYIQTAHVWSYLENADEQLELMVTVLSQSAVRNMLLDLSSYDFLNCSISSLPDWKSSHFQQLKTLQLGDDHDIPDIIVEGNLLIRLCMLPALEEFHLHAVAGLHDSAREQSLDSDAIASGTDGRSASSLSNLSEFHLRGPVADGNVLRQITALAPGLTNLSVPGIVLSEDESHQFDDTTFDWRYGESTTSPMYMQYVLEHCAARLEKLTIHLPEGPTNCDGTRDSPSPTADIGSPGIGIQDDGGLFYSASDARDAFMQGELAWERIWRLSGPGGHLAHSMTPRWVTKLIERKTAGIGSLRKFVAHEVSGTLFYDRYQDFCFEVVDCSPDPDEYSNVDDVEIEVHLRVPAEWEDKPESIEREHLIVPTINQGRIPVPFEDVIFPSMQDQEPTLIENPMFRGRNASRRPTVGKQKRLAREAEGLQSLLLQS